MRYPDKGGSAGSRLVPEVARGFPTVSKDGKTYTFRIRKGFRFNTGEAVTAGSFARAIERALDKKMAAYAASFISDVVGAEAVLAGKRVRPAGVIVKGDTLTLKLKAASADLVSRLAMRWLCAVPEDLQIDPRGVKLPPMAGPFYFAAREPGRFITLQRNPYYGGNRTPRVDTIQVSVNTSLETSLLQVRKGEADIDLAGLPAQSNADLAREFGINRGRYWVHPGLTTIYVALNTARGMLKDPSVRKALNYAVDRTVRHQGRGLSGRQAHRPGDTTRPARLPRMSRSTRRGRTSPGRRRCWRGAPASSRSIPRKGRWSSRRGSSSRASKSVGIDVTVKSFPFGVLLGRIGNPRDDPYDMILIGYAADYADPFNFVDLLLNGKRIAPRHNQSNLALFDDPRFNKQMDAAAKLTGDARYAAYAQLDEQIMRQAAPWVPLYNPTVREFVSARVGCYVYPPAFGFMSLAVACLK